MASKLTTEEIAEIKDPILIVDKEAILGKNLVERIGKDTQVVIVSKKKPSLSPDFTRSVLHVPFVNKFPSIPDGRYSAFFILDDKSAGLQKALPSFYNKAQNDKIQIVYAVSITNLDEHFIKEALNALPRLRVVVYGEVFDKSLSFGRETLINKILYEALVFGRIKVPQDAAVSTFPVFIDDVSVSLLETVFGNQNSRLFYVFQKHPPTALALSRGILKANPDIKVDFSPEKVIIASFPKTVGTYLLESDYPLDKRIKSVISQDISETFKAQRKKQDNSSRGRKFPIGSFLASVTFFLLLPLLMTFTFLIFGIFNLWQTQLAFQGSNTILVSFFSHSASDSFIISAATFKALSLEAGAIGLTDKAQALGENINAGVDLSKSLVLGLSSYNTFREVFSGKSNNPTKDFSDANLGLSNALVLIKKTQANQDVFPFIRSAIDKNNDFLKIVSSLQAILPEIIGIGGNKSYLILFQNNMELRPTGGFIGSYGLLSLSKGSIKNFSVNDVYDADGQLKGHVEPPFPIRRYLPSVHWYLRDSNFDLDFSEAAKEAAFFLKVEKNQNVDGVIAIDVSFVQKLLGIIGPVHVAEYNLDVNSDNFFSLAEQHSEQNFFPGSTQKKDFLGAVFRAIEQKVFEKKVSEISLFKALETGLLQKNILLASTDSSIQSLLNINGWSDSMLDQRSQDLNTVNDFLEINEANLGVNKVNYFVTRNVSANSIISDDGTVTAELAINYKNTSDGSVPGGDYKNYLRIVLPLGTKIISIIIDGQNQNIVPAVVDSSIYESKNFIPPSGFELNNYQEAGKDVFGMLLVVPKSSSKKIVFDYALPHQVDVSSPQSGYDMKFIKQPGIDSIPFDFSLSYPSSFNVVSTQNLSKEQGSLVFNNDLQGDLDFSASFASK